MRARKALGIAVILVGFLLAGSLPTVQAGNYLGEFCWQSPDGVVGKFAVNDMGAGHFLLNGRVMDPGGVGVGAVNGNAEVVGSQVYITITHMGKDESGTWGEFSRIILNLPDLNGTIEGVEVEHSTTNPGPYGNGMQLHYHSPETLTFVTCP